MNITFKGGVISMSTEIEVNNCFVILLFNYEWKCSTFTFVVEVMFNLKTATVTKIF